MKSIVPVLSVVLIIALLAFGVAAVSPVAQAEAEARRALIPGEVEAQDIANDAAKQRASERAAVWDQTAPALIASAKASLIVLTTVGVTLLAYLAVKTDAYFAKKQNAPSFQVVDSMALITHGDQTRVLDLRAGRIVDLFADVPADSEIARATIAAVMAQAQAAQPITLSALPSANTEV